MLRCKVGSTKNKIKIVATKLLTNYSKFRYMLKSAILLLNESTNKPPSIKLALIYTSFSVNTKVTFYFICSSKDKKKTLITKTAFPVFIVKTWFCAAISKNPLSQEAYSEHSQDFLATVNKNPLLIKYSSISFTLKTKGSPTNSASNFQRI